VTLNSTIGGHFFAAEATVRVSRVIIFHGASSAHMVSDILKQNTPRFCFTPFVFLKTLAKIKKGANKKCSHRRKIFN
jgi:hypothetical protein